MGGLGDVEKALGIAQQGFCLLADLQPDRRRGDAPLGALEQGDAKQVLKLANPGRQGRLGDETSLGGTAEMTQLDHGNQITKLAKRRQGAHGGLSIKWQNRSKLSF